MTTAAPAAPDTRAPARPLFVGIALAIVYVVWGSTYLGIRIMVEDMPPFLSAGSRFLTAGLLLATVLAVRTGVRRLAVTGPELLGCGLIGLLLPVLGQGMVTFAESGGAPSGITALLIAVVPLWVILYRSLSGERPRGPTVIGVLAGFTGLAVLIVSNGMDGSFPLWTMGVVVFATVSWSFGSWFQPRLRLPGDPFVVAVYEMLIGGGLLMVLGLVSGEQVDLSAFSTRSWVAWVYLVIFGSGVAFSAYVWLLQSAPISLVATYAYVNPLVAVFLGWLVLAEPVTPPIILGGAVVVLAVAVVVSSERPRRTPRRTAGSTA
ncbi:MAG: EamA family transporter [Propionibacteriales bacterium]|nr:EamA family transporter [Propionibacteriales bacterium]